MSVPMSPRVPVRVTAKETDSLPGGVHSEGPRKTAHVYTTVSEARGYTVKAGRATRERLHTGITIRRRPRPVVRDAE